MRKKIKREIRFCKCGCGYSKEVKITSTWQYHRGHFEHKPDCQCYSCKAKRGEYRGNKSPRWISKEVRFCACGCGKSKEVNMNSKWKFIRGHHLRVDRYKHRPEVWRKISKSLFGRVLSIQHRKNISKSRIGIKTAIKEIRECGWEECHESFEVPINSVKVYCSISCSSKRMFGENSSNWQGGIGKFPYPFDFNEKLKELIRERDNYTCQLCGKLEEENGRKLDVHHIDYVKENLDPDNLIALCRSCNVKVNYGRKVWRKFFQQKLKLHIVG